MLQDPQVLENDHNKSHSLMSDPITTMYFHNMSCDLSNKILFKPNGFVAKSGPSLGWVGGWVLCLHSLKYSENIKNSLL